MSDVEATDQDTNTDRYQRLNLGCGRDYREGWTNVDINPDFNPDKVIDLETGNWPLSDDTYTIVLADNVFEHIDPRNRPTFLREYHRVMTGDGQLTMRWPTPGFGGGWDVTHYQIPSWEWPDHPNNADCWETVSLDFQYSTVGRLIPQPIAKLLMWHGIRTILSVELVVSPLSETPEQVW